MGDDSRYILIADDNADSRTILSQLLTGAGFRVKTAKDGLEAMVELEKEQPCLLLLDLMMPNMSGFEILKRLQDSSKLRSVPVVVISAYLTEEMDPAQSSYVKLPGVRRVLPKAHFRIPKLLELINEVIEPKPAGYATPA